MSRKPLHRPQLADFYTRQEVADLLRLSPSTVANMVRDGRFPKADLVISYTCKRWSRKAVESFTGPLTAQEPSEPPSPRALRSLPRGALRQLRKERRTPLETGVCWSRNRPPAVEAGGLFV